MWRGWSEWGVFVCQLLSEVSEESVIERFAFEKAVPFNEVQCHRLPKPELGQGFQKLVVKAKVVRLLRVAYCFAEGLKGGFPVIS